MAEYTFDILRFFSDESDQVDGNPGCCVSVKHLASGKATSVTVGCPEKHTHSRACVVAALKAKTWVVSRNPKVDEGGKPVMVEAQRGFKRDPLTDDDVPNMVMVQAVEEVRISPWEKAKGSIQSIIQREEARKAAPKVDVEPLPKKYVVREGKNVEVTDVKIREEELL